MEPPESTFKPEATPLTKIRQLWILAAVSYGAVIVVIALAVWTYLHFFKVRENAENSTMIAIGSVWLPVYPGAITTRTDSVPRSGALESTFAFTTKDSASKVLSFYAPSLRTAHFRSYSSQRNASGGMLEALVSGRDSTLMISAKPSGSGSNVQITTIDRSQ